MSALNGDKARFQRLRKENLRRRDRSRVALAAMRSAAIRPVPGGGVDSDGGPGPTGGLRLIRGGIPAE